MLFCASIVPQNLCSVLAVDCTFNLSALFITVTVFKHCGVLRRATNDHLVFVGQFSYTYTVMGSTSPTGSFCHTFMTLLKLT